MRDAIVIGKGPAGMSAAIYLRRAGLSVAVVASGKGALEKAHKIENYYGFPEAVDAAELLDRGISQGRNLGVEFLEEEVVGIGLLDNAAGEAGDKNPGFLVKTAEGGAYEARGVVLATGSSRKAPDIPGLSELEGRGVSYCAVCDAFFYRGRNVAVLGNGSYALNEVQELLPVVGSVTVLTDGLEPEVEFPDRVSLRKEKIESFNEGEPNPLFGGAGGIGGTGGIGGGLLESVTLQGGEKIPVEGLFVALGTAGSTALARKVGAFTEGNSIKVDENMATSLPGLYAAGDCRGGLLQIAKAVSDGAIAGTSLVKYLREGSGRI